MEDSKVAKEGRTETLKDVKVPLREQVQTKLVKKLEELGEGQRTVEIWNGANARRGPWLKRQETFQKFVDEFLEPLHSKTADWSSNLHLPTVYVAAKTLHSRFMAALFGIDPPFTVRARQAANKERERLVSDMLSYTIKDWANHYRGIEPVIDQWIWDIVTAGSGTLKNRWERKYTRFVDVVEEQRLKNTFSVVNPETGEPESLPQYETVEREEVVTIPCFVGPAVDCINPEDVIIIGGEGDPQLADEVLQQQYLTSGELWTLADQKVFRTDIVKEIVEGGEDHKSGEPANGIKILRAETAGQPDIDHDYDLKRYQVIERYARIDVDGSGVPADVVLWVHKDTAKILRATYLYRISKTGKRPYHRAFFHKRRGDENGVGLPELMYSLAMEIDAMTNMRIDFGLISSLPFGYYRPTSSLTDERMALEPGMMIPLDNPQTDVYFPSLGARWAFSAQETQFMMQQIERMTSISDLNLGVMNGSQGAARTATGARALLGESNANLSVYLKRINIAWRGLLQQLLEMIQEKMPEGLEFRLTGEDGASYFYLPRTREEVAGQFDLAVDGNSENSNRAIQLEQAASTVATVMNPLLVQLGVVTPLEIYEALRTQFLAQGVRDFSKYIRKPQGAVQIYTPEELANATLAGINIKLGPEQDLQGFIEFWNYIEAHDELLGQMNEQQTVALAKKAAEAQAMLEAVAAQNAQLANAQQVSTNAALATPSPQAVGTAQGQAATSGGQAPLPQ